MSAPLYVYPSGPGQLGDDGQNGPVPYSRLGSRDGPSRAERRADRPTPGSGHPFRLSVVASGLPRA